MCLTTCPGEVRQRRHYPIGLDVKYVGVWIKPELLIDKYGLDPARLPEGLRNFFTGADHDPFCTSFPLRSEEHTSELQSLMRISYAVFCLKKKKNTNTIKHIHKTLNK